MSYQACKVITSVKDAKINYLKNSNKTICKLKSSEVILQFHNRFGKIIVYFSDAVFANFRNG